MYLAVLVPQTLYQDIAKYEDANEGSHCGVKGKHNTERFQKVSTEQKADSIHATDKCEKGSTAHILRWVFSYPLYQFFRCDFC